MAYYVMDGFEDENGTWCRSCKHADCESYRRMRNSTCRVCGKGFQKGDLYSFDPEGTDGYAIIHYGCLLGEEKGS